MSHYTRIGHVALADKSTTQIFRLSRITSGSIAFEKDKSLLRGILQRAGRIGNVSVGRQSRVINYQLINLPV